ncbi:prolipoprotein diacylglyceryl transferase, partial [Candidatus Woesearchaeota archaeon CG08_land_8_20_14_0_20_43_7]
MFIHNIDPVLLSIGPFHIRYYGINYALALLIFIFLMRYLIGKYKMIDLTKDDV